MKKFLYLFFTFCLFSVIEAYPVDAEALRKEYTLFIPKPNYTGAKSEPQKGIYLGSYVLQNSFIDQSMDTFNKLTGKPHSSFFKYVGYGKPFPKEWVEEVKSLGAVPHIAFEPNDGLESVTDDDYLRQFAKDAKEAGVPIFLRYASEMNGTWTQYSGKSELYKEKWKLVHDVMDAEAPNVIMVWCVFTFPEETIDMFYPGDAYVDWVGVNIYNVIYHNNNLKSGKVDEDPLKLLDYVYNTYSYKKPIQICEFGASHYTTTDHQSYISFAREKITRLYNNLPIRYPRVKAIFYFDTNNIVDGLPSRQVNDYSITNNSDILKTYSSCISSDYYLSSVPHQQVSKTWNETLSFNSNYKFINNVLYVDPDFITHYMDIPSSLIDNNQKSISKITFTKGGKSLTVITKPFNIPKGFYNQQRHINGVPLRQICDAFGYSLTINPDKNHIYIATK